jgi:hypothetical protein
MRLPFKRALATLGALAIGGSALLLPASAAQADGAYYGTWKLTHWRLNGVTIACPGSFELPPPAPNIVCTDNETLVLKDGYRYKASLRVFAQLEARGGFEVITFPGSKHKVIVFDADQQADNPRAYRMRLIGAKAGTPNKMKIFLSTTSRDGSTSTAEMIFSRVG